MKKQSKVFLVATIILAISAAAGCQKDASSTNTVAAQSIKLPALTEKTLASLGQGNFSLWGTCSDKPYNISGTNGICVPVGGTSCSSNFLGAQQTEGKMLPVFNSTVALKEAATRRTDRMKWLYL